MQKLEIRRYDRLHAVSSPLNPLEDIVSWVEGLTSARYVGKLLTTKHCLEGPTGVDERSKVIANLVDIACKYLEQAWNGPKDVSFLPIYYAILNLSKAYVAIGPYAHQLNENRWHGASHELNKDIPSLDDDFIKLQEKGAIPLLYQTLVGESMFENEKAPLTVYMRDIYPYIPGISAEYGLATGKEPRLIPFQIWQEDKEGKQRIVAKCPSMQPDKFKELDVCSLQAFRGLHKDDASGTLVSDFYEQSDAASLKACLRPAMLYGRLLQDPMGNELELQFVPQSGMKLLLPEELPLLCAFFHMSCVVRYNPDGLRKLMDSEYWPTLLVLRKHGVYRFLLLFWSFVTQCCTYIVGD